MWTVVQPIVTVVSWKGVDMFTNGQRLLFTKFCCSAMLTSFIFD